MLVWVASYPRSGNTLTLVTLRDVFKQKSIGTIFREDLELGRLLDRIAAPDPDGTHSADDAQRGLAREQLIDELRTGPELHFVKTHRLEDARDPAPALYVVRDGRDAIVSHAHYVGDRGTPRWAGTSFNQRVAGLIAPGVPVFGHWSRNVHRWRTRRGPVALVRFEELIADPVGSVGRSCAALGIEVKARGKSLTFADHRHRAPAQFRRGIVGSHRDEMPPRLEERFWRIHGEQMQALGYTRG